MSFDKALVEPEWLLFPISRDPPEGGTSLGRERHKPAYSSFQFLGIPPKGEQHKRLQIYLDQHVQFPISRDPPEGGTRMSMRVPTCKVGFQFLGIPPKGELENQGERSRFILDVSNF